VSREDGHSLENVKFKCLRSSMLISLTLPRTWRTAKCLGSGILLKHMLSWTWLTIKSKCLEFDIFVRSTLPYFLEHVKGRWSFPQTFQEGVCILMGMLGAWHIVKLSVPETWPKASRFGWRQTQYFGTWHTAKTNHGWVWLAPDPAFLELGTLSSPITFEFG